MVVGLSTPGTKLNEVAGDNVVTGVGIGLGSFVGVSERGPIDEARLCSSWAQFQRIYGSYYKGNHLAYAVASFFRNGGSGCYVSRVLASDYVIASLNLKDYADVNTLKVKALNGGVWANGLSITTTRVDTETTAQITSGATSVALKNLTDVKIGDYFVINGTLKVYVRSKNISTNEIFFPDVGTVNPAIASGASAKTATDHKVSTKLSADLINGATQASVLNANGIEEGTVITVFNATDLVEIVVNDVSGKIIFFDSVTLTSTIPSGANVVSQEFNLKVLEKGDLKEEHKLLSMYDGSVDFVETRLSGTTNPSEYIELEDLDSATSDKTAQIPTPIEAALLSGGSDGTTAGDNDYIGSQTEGAKSGIYLFDNVKEINYCSIPGITTKAVQDALLDWCEWRHTVAMPVFAALETPLLSNLPLEAQEWKNVTLARDTTHGAIYYPWVKISDPVNGNGKTVDISPVGGMQGIYSRVATSRGPHKAPANEEFRGAVGLTHYVSDTEHGILNNSHVNVIKSFVGRGIRPYGSRCLTVSITDGRHLIGVRLALNYLEESIIDSSQPDVFEPNDEALWDKIRYKGERFLRQAWNDGLLTPRNDMTRAFFFKVDGETTTQADINNLVTNVRVGVNISKHTEFIVFQFGLWDGGASLAEG